MVTQNQPNDGLLTIALTSYNYAHYIAEAVQSVVDQTSPEWRLIIFDNCSTDNTMEVLQPFLIDPRITVVVRDENVGLKNNHALALRSIDTEFVATLQADDFLAPTFVEVALRCLREYPDAPFVFFNWQHFIDESRQYFNHNSFPFSPQRTGRVRIGPFLTVRNFVPFHMAVFRTRCLQSRFDAYYDSPLLQVGEQYLLKMLEDAYGWGCYAGTLGGYWRRHGQQLTAEHVTTASASIEEPIERHWYASEAPNPDPVNAFMALAGFVLLSSHVSLHAAVRWLLGKGENYARRIGIPVEQARDRLQSMALTVALKFSTFSGVALIDDDGAREWLRDMGFEPTGADLKRVLSEVMEREGESLLNEDEIERICDKFLNADRRRIVVYSGDDTPWACAQIRLLQPFQHLTAAYELVWGVKPKPGSGHHCDLSLLEGADLVVIQRYFVLDEHKDYVERILNSGRPVVFEMDDLLFDLPADNPLHAAAQASRDFIRSVIDRVDAVIVSTPALERAVRDFGRPKRVFVLANAVDVALLHAPLAARPEPVRIALTGTPTHMSDFALLDAALEKVIRKYGMRVILVFMGAVPDRWRNHPNVTTVEFVPDYRLFARTLPKFEFDIALVPLADNAFNRAKSNIKWLEYAAAGVAGIFTDLEPYAAVRHGETGLKVANATEAWYEAICDLIDHPDKRLAIARAAQAEVEAEYAVEVRAADYAAVYRRILHAAGKGVGGASRAVPAEQGGAGEERPSPEQLYKVWQLAHVPQERDAEWIAERLAELSAPPLFHLALIALEGNEGWLANNINALAGQFYKRWRLTVVAEGPVPDFLAGLEVVRWVQLQGEAPLEAVNRVLAESEADWVGMLEAGDKLAPHAFFALADKIDRHPEWTALYTDEDSLDPEGNRANPFLKTDFNLDMVRAAPFAVGGLLMLKRELFGRLGGFRPPMEGVEYYDLVLRAWEATGDAGFGHVADVLYHRFVEGGHSQREAEAMHAARQQALEEHLARCGLEAELWEGLLPSTYQIRYRHPTQPLVSIIIPTRNQMAFLQRCLDTLTEKTAYTNYEILVVDNGSDEADAVEFLAQLRRIDPARLRVIDYPRPFNFAAMNNLAAREARGDYLLLLNNDTAVLHAEWLDEMLGHAQRPDVGVVGARLLLPDGRIQHAGVILGIDNSPAELAFNSHEEGDPGYFGRLQLTQDLSAVTGACLLIRKSIYDAVGGLDEARFGVSYNDIDLCLKVREQGYRVVWTPFAVLLHEGSASQLAGIEKTAETAKIERFRAEQDAMYDKWRRQIAFDPAYNRNLSFADRSFLIEISPMLSLDPEWRPRPRILAHPADRMGCGEYRIIAPMRALNAAGRVLGWETGNYLSTPELFRFEPDVLVLQRQVEWTQVEGIERYMRHSKAFRVFEIDDLITNVPVKSSRKKVFVEMKDLHKRFRKAVGLCQRFVVSTEFLAEEYRGYTDEVVTVPNFLERERWGKLPTPLRRQGDKPRVGWAGSVTHDGDLAEIIEVVKATADEVDWVFFGMCPKEIRPLVKEFHEPVALDAYPAKLASLNLDLAVAPLEDVPFNHAKSHLRLLEYGVLGYPVVCTDITPYRGDYPVTRVRNRFKDWVEAIRSHVADLDELARRGDALREHVNSRWILEDNLDLWMKAWLP